MCIISWGSTPHLVWILDFKTSKSFLAIVSLFFTVNFFPVCLINCDILPLTRHMYCCCIICPVQGELRERNLERWGNAAGPHAVGSDNVMPRDKPAQTLQEQKSWNVAVLSEHPLEYGDLMKELVTTMGRWNSFTHLLLIIHWILIST